MGYFGEVDGRPKSVEEQKWQSDSSSVCRFQFALSFYQSRGNQKGFQMLHKTVPSGGSGQHCDSVSNNQWSEQQQQRHWLDLTSEQGSDAPFPLTWFWSRLSSRPVVRIRVVCTHKDPSREVSDKTAAEELNKGFGDPGKHLRGNGIRRPTRNPHFDAGLGARAHLCHHHTQWQAAGQKLQWKHSGDLTSRWSDWCHSPQKHLWTSGWIHSGSSTNAALCDAPAANQTWASTDCLSAHKH